MLSSIARRIRAPFQSTRPIPPEHEANFRHLVWDMAWFGVHSGTTIAFIVIYATRLGASGEQVGLINAMPAIVALIFSLPASTWLQKRSTRSSVFWSSLFFRIFYIAPVLFPFFFGSSAQIWAIILMLLLMNIPGTVLMVGFNALFAEAVPPEWRGYVAGLRNAVYALCATITTLISGVVLTRFSIPTGYQIVFAIGFIGAMISSYHLWFVRPSPAYEMVVSTSQPAKGGSLKRRLWDSLHLDVLRGPFRVTALLLLFFHFTQYLGIPVFPLWMVNELHFSDQTISLGTSIFNIFLFFASLQYEKIAFRLGNKILMGLSVIGLGVYPILLSVSWTLPVFILTSLIGGANLAMLNGTLYNYLLEKVPAHDRPAHLAWYSLVLNAAILLGSMIGPGLGVRIGLGTALLVYAALRVLAGAAILRWG